MDDVMETPNSEDPYREYSLLAVLRIDRATVTGFTKNFNGQRPLTSIAQSNVVVEKSHNNKSSTHEVTNTYVYR